MTTEQQAKDIALASADAMVIRLNNLQRGDDPIPYHTGQLANDREGASPDHIRLNKIADAAYKGAMQGRLYLWQKKVYVDPEGRGRDIYEYIAVGAE